MKNPFRKRNLYLVHRWLGIFLCLLFAAWFVTGVIMLYARMPLLYASERLAGLEPVDFARVALSPGVAWEQSGQEGTPNRARLTMVGGRPTYFFLSKGEKWRGVRADDGAILAPLTAAEGAEEARRFLRASALPAHVSTFDGIDQWTFSNSMNLHRPLHRYRYADPDETEVYVSQVTGEVVNKTTRGERLGALVGAYAHWLAPSPLRREASVWRNLLLYLSLAGTALTVTGIVIGFLRFRREGYPGRAGVAGKLPYRGVLAWHSWSGLIFGGATLCWMFSAVLYMNPGGSRSGPLSTVTTVTPYNEGGIRADLAPRPEQTKAFSGGPLVSARFTVPPASASARASRPGEPIKEVEMVTFAGRPRYVLYRTDADSEILPADSETDPPQPRFTTEELTARARAAVPGANVTSAEMLTRYDAYYYAVGAVAPKRLPIYLVKFDDPAGTWLYVNPHNGTIFRRYDHHGRLMRWLVNGLHCLDFPFLIENRPLWDIAVIGLSLGGLALSVSAVIASGKRLRLEARAKK
jgi:hypothetical protein